MAQRVYNTMVAIAELAAVGAGIALLVAAAAVTL